jgi:hypothetical protein
MAFETLQSNNRLFGSATDDFYIFRSAEKRRFSVKRMRRKRRKGRKGREGRERSSDDCFV